MVHERIEKLVYRAIISTIGIVTLLYVCQGVIVRLRLTQLDSQIVPLTQLREECDSSNCRSWWHIKPNHKLILIGHILRTHSLQENGGTENILPVSSVRGTSSDSWAGLRIYSVQPGLEYTLYAEKPKAALLGYFTGILPRSTNNEGILSIPDISPSISSLTGLVGIGLLLSLLGAAYVGQGGRSRANVKQRRLLNIIVFAACLASLAGFISTGALDSLMPEGEPRNKILRYSLLMSLIAPTLGFFPFFNRGRSGLRILAGLFLVLCLLEASWGWIRAGAGWGIVQGVFVAILMIAFIRNRFYLSAVLIAFSFADTARIFGVILQKDYPPIYLFNTVVVFSFCIVAAKSGAVQAISMAGIAYKRFRRDVLLTQIQRSLGRIEYRDSADGAAVIQEILPDLSQLLGAGRLCVVISLPLGRPITQIYEAKTAKTTTFDDGKITGAATLRAMVYGDEAWFERYSDFASKLRLPINPDLEDSHFFCVIPIKVNSTIIGAMMLTRFDDQYIEQAKKNGDLAYDSETIRTVIDRLASSFSNLMVQDLHAFSTRAKELQTRIHKLIGASTSIDTFLSLYAAAIHQVTTMRVMIHQRIDERGVAIVQSGLKNEDWQRFVNAPFNLSPTAIPAYGTAAVAFREGKSSYVKDVHEIFGKLQQRTQDFLTQMNAKTLVSVPMQAPTTQYVITAVSERNLATVDPGVVGMIESTEAIFIAAIEVMNQKTSVMALGQLANRLIGDEEVRGKILQAAKAENLPTTIGTARTSFLLLIDLAGSSDLTHDTQAKAEYYGRFYDAVNQRVQSALGGCVRKTIGDAVIVTWDGTNIDLNDNIKVLESLEEVTVFADEVAKSFGCTGVRTLLHYGSYFFGLVGTSTFGQIDVIGSGIDEVCKMEGSMKGRKIDGQSIKLAISCAAGDQLTNLKNEDYQSNGFVQIQSSDSNGDRPGANEKTRMQLRFCKAIDFSSDVVRLRHGA